MMYAVNYRDMHTAVHGLALFTKKADATRAYMAAKSRIGHDDYEIVVSAELSKCSNLIEEVNYRDIKEVMTDVKYQVNFKGKTSLKLNSVNVINPTDALDLF